MIKTTLAGLFLAAPFTCFDQPDLALCARPLDLPPPAPVARSIDLALCLDTSGSMGALIDAAREKLWSIVNEMALAEPQPELRVALLSYGHDSHDPNRGWVRIDSPLTTDLDRISEQLFALTTNGGTEYVARVVDSATRELEWSRDPGALKLIVVAGNEAAEQDPEIPTEEASGRAIAQGIQVNALYCNGAGDAYADGWAQVARRADGFYAAIDPGQTQTITTPFDGRMAELSGFLNETYVPVGVAGQRSWANQSVQDSNAIGMNQAAAAARAQTKAGKLYSTTWDLVQRSSEEEFSWTSVKCEELPEELRELSSEELQGHVRELENRRAKLSAEIQDLGQQRSKWMAEQVGEEGAGFDRALLEALRGQASARGWVFPTAEPQGQAEGVGVEEPVVDRRAVVVRRP